jgi:hypothetical protein
MAFLGLFLGETRTASATLPLYCYADKETHPWFSPQQVVPIYMNTVGANSAPTATSISSTNLADALKRAIYIWNEQAGASIKLRYMGATSSTAISNAVVVVGNSAQACGSPGSGAEADVVYGFVPYWLWSRITLYKFRGNCGFTPWVLTPSEPSDSAATDVVRTLIHELGHAVYNMGHPNDDGYSDQDCIYSSLLPTSVMGATSRSLGNWDLEVAQQRYGVRAQYSIFQKSYMTSPITWKPIWEAAPGSGARPLFRMGSIGQLLDVRPLGFVENGGTSVKDGGVGTWYDVAQYNVAQLKSWYHLTTSLGRPVALASQPSTVPAVNPPVDFLMAYQKFIGTNIYEDPTGEQTGKVCWRRSTNGGLTWGAESCSIGITDVLRSNCDVRFKHEQLPHFICKEPGRLARDAQYCGHRRSGNWQLDTGLRKHDLFRSCPTRAIYCMHRCGQSVPSGLRDDDRRIRSSLHRHKSINGHHFHAPVISMGEHPALG